MYLQYFCQVHFLQHLINFKDNASSISIESASSACDL